MNVLIDTKEIEAAKADAAPAARPVVVRFAGDSGDGIQLAGLQFARTTASGGADLMTLPEFPAEIRAPAGTTFGVSAYQVQFGPGEVLTPGDEADLLVAFNPAAFATNIQFLKRGGTAVVDEGAFNARGFAKAGLAGDPVDETPGATYRTIRVDVSKRTLEAVEDFGLGRKDAMRARNFWALGLALWLAGQTTEAAEAWIEGRFRNDAATLGANRAAVRAGHAYGETMELSLAGIGGLAPQARRAGARMISGTDAMALGIAAVGALAGRPVNYCSYPITPASALLHSLARIRKGIRTFQAEDEIAAVASAIGASFGGALGMTASSGPGLALKTEGLGLAIAAELPLVVVDVQRAGPSTGMPTKPEQSDLDMAVYGRHGEAPLPVLAPATSEDCFWIMIDAARIAIAGMTPVIVLSDAYLANAVSEWVPPDAKALTPIVAREPGEGTAARDPMTLALPWIRPGTPGREFRVGGIEKDAATGNISYDPANHEAMVKLRAEKVARAMAGADRPFLFEGPEDGDLLVVGWGSTFGPIRQAVRDLAEQGHEIAHLHLRHVWPLPAGIGPRLARYGRVAAAEMNTGQLSRILRAETLLPVEPVTQVNGRPFRVDTLKAAFGALLPGVRP